MYAVVENMTPEQSDDWTLNNGDRIEVIGFTHQGQQLMVVWRDDEGYVLMVPSWAIRMDPFTVKVEA